MYAQVINSLMTCAIEFITNSGVSEMSLFKNVSLPIVEIAFFLVLIGVFA